MFQHHLSWFASLLQLGVVFIFRILTVYLDHFASTGGYTFAFLAFLRRSKAIYCMTLILRTREGRTFAFEVIFT